MSVGAPCGMSVGLKWPPADVKSAALQSPTSWMWKPWVPGGAPLTSAMIFTSPPLSRKVTSPAMVAPSRGTSCALAISTSASATTSGAGGGGGGGGSSCFAQPAPSASPATTTAPIHDLFISQTLLGSSVSSGRRV